MSLEQDDLAGRLTSVVGILARRLRAYGTTLTPAALSALASISRVGAVRPGDLARLEGTSAPGVTRLIAELEQRGYVTREDDPADRRSVLVRITAEGEAAVLEARRARAEGVAALLDACEESEREAIAEAVGALERALLATAPDGRRAPLRT